MLHGYSNYKMTARLNFLFINIVNLITAINTLTAIQDFIYRDHSYEYTKDIRQHFHDKIRQNRVNGRRVELLDKYLSNTSVYVDGIAHHLIVEKHSDWEQVNKIENEYKDLIQMRGAKYTYKRDTYWRTWRKVEYSNGNYNVVCYRCTNSLNSTNCQYGGYWVIEEKPPPCPFEIFSVINERELCAINITNNTSIEKTCPLIVQFSELTAMCDNPIITKWRIMKTYDGNVSERFPDVICNERDFCETSTVYTISKDYVSFRIINSTNHIIYSRIMKNGGKNYACVKCGRIDPNTNGVAKTENPLSFDLTKKKRDYNLQKEYEDLSQSTLKAERVLNLLEKEKLGKILGNAEEYSSYFRPPEEKHRHSTHGPSCQSLKLNLENDNWSDD